MKISAALRVVLLLVPLWAATAGVAGAAERGFYIIGDYTANTFRRDASLFNQQLDIFLECGFAVDPFTCTDPADVAITGSSHDRKARGYDLTVGYQFSDWLAVEGSYAEFGRVRQDFDGTIDFGDGPLPLTGTARFHTRGPTVAAVGTLPLGDFFSIEGRAGLLFADNKLKLAFSVSDGTTEQGYTYSESDSKTSLFYGVGATFWITTYLGLRGAYTVYKDGSFDGDTRQYSVGLRYSYGY